ncbi:hypothetical protein ACOPJQ_12590 [Luteimonas dalianensis]|uniref:hypothetical protein n=1 Tax=Luteimonas dalianensis TaxID=1148196 RepID=UPI003BEFAB58
MTRFLLLACALALPLSAHADDADNANCRHSDPRQLTLDMDGVSRVMFDVGPHKLRLDASPGATGALQGRACASDADWLEDLKVEQRRDGDRLHVRLYYDRTIRGLSLGRNYARLDLSGSIPDDVLVQLQVGAGDAWLTGASSMSADVGSGDVEARRIAGLVTAKVASGDIDLDDIGTLHVLSVGSGDVEAGNVRGDVEIGSIGSGDLEIHAIGGNAGIQSVGSGDASLHHVQGSVSIGSIGSGDVELREVGGSVTVNGIGSGDLEVRGVGGDLTVLGKGSGDVRHEGVTGQVDVPRRR